MEKDKLLITLKDTRKYSSKVREMDEIQEMLTEISETVDKYGFEVRSIDCGMTVILPGRIRSISIGHVKFPVDRISDFQLTSVEREAQSEKTCLNCKNMDSCAMRLDIIKMTTLLNLENNIAGDPPVIYILNALALRCKLFKPIEES